MQIVGIRARFGVLSEPNVVPLSLATLFNAGGNTVYGVALGWLAYDVTGSPLAVGAVLGLRTLPIVFIGLISGTINDRVHRPTVLKLYALYYTAVSFGFTLLLYFGDVNVAHMLAYMFLLGLAFTFGPNARRAIYADSVPKNRVVDALAVDGATFSLGHAVMPAIVGIVLATFGVTVAFAMQGVLYGVMALLALRVNTPRATVERAASRPAFFKSVVEGLSYARSKPGVLRMLGLTTLLSLVSGVYFLVPVFSVEVFDAGATGIGLILTGGAVGSLVGPLAVFVLRRRVGSARMLAGSIAVLGLSTIGFALAPSLAWAVVAFAVGGTTGPVLKATTDGYMQLSVPSEFRGRIGALNQMTRGTSSLAGLIAGGAAQLVGLERAVIAGGLVVLAIAFWSLPCRCQPALRWRSPELQRRHRRRSPLVRLVRTHAESASPHRLGLA